MRYSYLTRTVLVVALTVTAGLAVSACASPRDEAPLAGAILWQQTCQQCHEFRSPADYDDQQWETLVEHMRTRANLPAEDAEAILAFLQSGN